MEALHWQETNDRGVRVVRVPDLRFLRYYTVSGDYWPLENPGQSTDNWMGQQIRIMAKGESVGLRISGRYRPGGLGSVEISVANGSELSAYQIAQGDTRTINIPRDVLVTVTASTTFVPDQRIHNGDQRELSVVFSLTPTAEPSQ